MATIDETLPQLLEGVPRTSLDEIHGPLAEAVRGAVQELDRLLGDTLVRVGRWGDLYRHLSFSQGHDWHDIAEMDWPDVKARIVAATYSELEPIPVPEVDLGTAAATQPSGPAATALNWEVLDPEVFERLLFNLLSVLPNFQNAQWLMRTNAPDRGRDISAERVIDDDAGGGPHRTSHPAGKALAHEVCQRPGL